MTLRDIAGPSGAPAVVLLHGWTATADINFYKCYRPLAEHFRVVAFDHRGHGSGIKSLKPFRLADCADDVVALADQIGLESFIPVGYSLGGAVAQLAARHNPDRVRGVVFCSTAARFNGVPITRRTYYGLSGLATMARMTPAATRRRLTNRYFHRRKQGDWEPWALEQAADHDWRMVLEAGASLGTFNSTSWVSQLDMPTSVVITERDEVVPPARQHELADLLHDATTFPIGAGHEAAVGAPKLFMPSLVAAIESVVERAT